MVMILYFGYDERCELDVVLIYGELVVVVEFVVFFLQDLKDVSFFVYVQDY